MWRGGGKVGGEVGGWRGVGGCAGGKWEEEEDLGGGGVGIIVLSRRWKCRCVPESSVCNKSVMLYRVRRLRQGEEEGLFYILYWAIYSRRALIMLGFFPPPKTYTKKENGTRSITPTKTTTIQPACSSRLQTSPDAELMLMLATRYENKRKAPDAWRPPLPAINGGPRP